MWLKRRAESMEIIKNLKQKIRFFIYRMTEVKKTIRFTVKEKERLADIGKYCLNDTTFDFKSKGQISKLIKRTQKKKTRLNYYECQSLVNLIYFEANDVGDSQVRFRELVDKISSTAYDFRLISEYWACARIAVMGKIGKIVKLLSILGV